MTYDVCIIGTGPAGLSAALNLKLHNKSILWFGSSDLSMKVGKSEKIANYPGIPYVSGEELNKCFLKQIKEAELEITDKMVTNVTATRKGFMILADNEIFEARALLLATGAFTAKPMPGEEEFLGRGVSYCATCDGFLYRGKTIAVHCGAERYEHEVEYLAEIADKVYLSTAYKDSKIDLPNVELLDSQLGKVNGEMKVTGIETVKGETHDVDGVFILRTAVAPTALMNGLEMDGPHIAVDREMKTNKKGCYAAGDCTGRPYQIAKAVGEGNIAAHAILEYLAELDKEN
ncbi:MAG: NAD(P)/FAD-dependent oxidoreductase [Firmicutes bacterium]|nr:NAD(P)/FAD-dependent oxidoreductase [Bacillota bacterium]